MFIFSGKSSESESRDQVQVHRSASQRLVERRGRLASQKSKTSEDESSEHTLQRRKKGTVDKLRMSSRWRRSKSQDRESPTRSKSKERKFFGRLENCFENLTFFNRTHLKTHLIAKNASYNYSASVKNFFLHCKVFDQQHCFSDDQNLKNVLTRITKAKTMNWKKKSVEENLRA